MDASLLAGESRANAFAYDFSAAKHHERNKLPYILTLPFSLAMTLWVAAKKKILAFGGWRIRTNHVLFDGFGKKLRLIKEGAASWKALDLIYNHRFGQNRSIGGFLEDFWIGMINAQAVRNRARLIKYRLRSAIEPFVGRSSEVRLLSLACGSAQAVLEVVAAMRREGVFVRVLLIDRDVEALAHAERLADRYGVRDRVHTKCLNVFRMEYAAEQFKPHVVEMLGLLDYLERPRAVWIIRRIRDILASDGVFLTCNIRHNMEMYFLQWVIDWPMIYRSPGEFASIVAEAGFPYYFLEYEPLKIHGIAVASK